MYTEHKIGSIWKKKNLNTKNMWKLKFKGNPFALLQDPQTSY